MYMYMYIVHVPSPSFLLVILAALLSNRPRTTAASNDRTHQPKPGYFK